MGVREIGEFSDANSACEAFDDVIARVNLEERRRVFSEGGDQRAGSL